jgi:homoserine acetyltransferase
VSNILIRSGTLGVSRIMEEHRGLWWDSPAVELGRVIRLDIPDGMTFIHGGHLPEIQVSYESWGSLIPARDNAILIIHPLASDCRVTGDFAGQPVGWWEQLVGPGRALDTERCFVISLCHLSDTRKWGHRV